MNEFLALAMAVLVAAPGEGGHSVEQMQALMIDDARFDGLIVPAEGAEVTPSAADLRLIIGVLTQVQSGKAFPIYGEPSASFGKRRAIVSTYIFEKWPEPDLAYTSPVPKGVSVTEIRTALRNCGFKRMSLLAPVRSSPGSRFIMTQWKCPDKQGRKFEPYSTVRITDGAVWTFYLTLDANLTAVRTGK